MNIEIIEDKLQDITDEKYSAIIELIVNAVRDYPLFSLNDTDLYFSEIKKIIKAENITSEALKNIINENPNKDDENNIWIISSLSSLLEAFELMKLYNVPFDVIKSTIATLK